MPSPAGPQTQDINSDLADLLALLRHPQAISAGIAALQPFENVSWHDFAYNHYVLPTNEGYRFEQFPLSQAALSYIQELENSGAAVDEIDTLGQFLQAVENSFRRAIAVSVGLHETSQYTDPLLQELYDGSADLVRRMFAQYLDCIDTGAGAFFLQALYEIFRIFLSKLKPSDFPDPTFWTDLDNNDFTKFQSASLAPTLSNFARQSGGVGTDFTSIYLKSGHSIGQEYTHEIFPENSVNFGARVIYRQQWKPLATQPGDIVRTLPLGPGEEMKVSVKIVRRTKSTNSMETQTEIETLTESSQTTKDSTEIVNEAAHSNNWKVDANAGLDLGFLKVGASGGGGTTDDEKSKQTRTGLNEAMQKASSKLRQQTKVVVSRESESTFEQERSSVIKNTNNEIAITYEYRKRQQQYEVSTLLNAVQTVIYVAEHVPDPNEIQEDWVRRYDWILATVLKDESFRSTLNALSTQVDDVDPVEGPNDPFAKILSAATDGFGKFQPNAGFPAASGGAASAGLAVGGLSIPDIYAEPQRIYQQRVAQQMERTSAKTLRSINNSRLFHHIRDNILYYCRAIWSAEDPDQRLLRYKKNNLQVPLAWEMIAGLPASVGAVTAPLDVQFRPTGESVPIGDVIDTSGPIGYTGNYSIYLLQPLSESSEYPRPARAVGKAMRSVPVTLASVLNIIREPYVDPVTGLLRDPSLQVAIKTATAQTQITPEELKDFLYYLPWLQDQFLNTAGQVDAKTVTPTHPISADQWAEYLYRKESTSQLLVDTDNVSMDILVGDGSALEPFKLVHRYADAIDALENVKAQNLKNQRRELLMSRPDEYDPDIQKVVIVSDGKDGVSKREAASEAATAGVSPVVTPSATANTANE
jgi:hypothetical protein